MNVLPVIVREVKPEYTHEAMKARVEGTVLLEAVVGDDGAVGDVRVARSLDDGLDAEAVKAMKQWLFRSGT